MILFFLLIFSYISHIFKCLSENVSLCENSSSYFAMNYNNMNNNSNNNNTNNVIIYSFGSLIIKKGDADITNTYWNSKVWGQ